MSRKVAFVTGITGQDGSYLAEFLLGKGYEVHGLIRRSSTFNTSRINHIYEDPHDPDPKLFLHYGDLIDGVGLTNLIREIQPTEVYNLGAQSHVQVSFSMPQYTGQVDAVPFHAGGPATVLVRRGWRMRSGGRLCRRRRARAVRRNRPCPCRLRAAGRFTQR